MSLTIIRYPFDGPFHNVSDLKNEPGAFVVFGTRESSPLMGVIDTGSSSDIKAKVEQHKNRECWKTSGYDGLQYAAHYADESSARSIAGEIAKTLEPLYTDYEIRIND